MCGRFDFHATTADIAALCAELGDVVGDVEAQTHHYNLAPTQKAMAAHSHVHNGTTRLGPMQFGMPWPHGKGMVLNARSETAADKPMFRQALQARRCLVFANGFYEWTKQKSHKQPYYFAVEDAPVFAFAGLYTIAHDNAPHFVILTTKANACVEPLHHRMPVILPRNTIASWLDKDASSQTISALLVPYTASPMRVHPVSTKVNSPSFDLAACIEPVAL